jgi:hypothetical protein
LFHFQLGSEFKADAQRRARAFSPMANRISQGILAGARNVIIGGVAGWGVVVVAGAVMMSNVSHDDCCKLDSPATSAAVATSSAPEPAAAKPAPEPVAPAPAKPAPPPAAPKSTQRIDMSPTAAIPPDPAPKPKHKPHKKKLDKSN